MKTNPERQIGVIEQYYNLKEKYIEWRFSPPGDYNVLVNKKSGVIYKSCSRSNQKIADILIKEGFTLQALSCSRTETPRTPTVFNLSYTPETITIIEEYIDINKRGAIGFVDIKEVIEWLQQPPVESFPFLATRSQADYLKESLLYARFLRKQGGCVGISQKEYDYIMTSVKENINALNPFRQVLVHGDIRLRHLVKLRGQVIILDFEKVSLGNELEDWARVYCAYPALGAKIKSYLQQKYQSQPQKFKQLNEAFSVVKVRSALEALALATIRAASQPSVFNIAQRVLLRRTLWQ